DGAYKATLVAQKLWHRNSTARKPEVLRLAEVRGRLELFIGAAFGITLPISPAEPPISPNLFWRLGRRIPKHLIERRTLAATDGVRLRLPPSLPANEGLLKYRLLASEAAVRAVRGTAGHVPSGAMERFLYQIREAAAVDGWLEESLPGLQSALRGARDE